MHNGILADGLLWFCGSSILQIVKCGLKMRHNQVTMKCKDAFPGTGPELLAKICKHSSAEMRGVALAHVRGIWHCQFNTVKSL